VRVNPLQLNALVDEATKVEICKRLMYIHCMINSTPIVALVDYGATHNFIHVETAKRLGLHLCPNCSTIKIVTG